MSRSCSMMKRSEEHTSELQSRLHLVCRLLLEKKKTDNMQSLDTAIAGPVLYSLRQVPASPPATNTVTVSVSGRNPDELALCNLSDLHKCGSVFNSTTEGPRGSSGQLRRHVLEYV